MQYTSKFSGEEVDLILDNVESKQNKSTLVGDLATKVNALSASDKASFLGKIGAMPATPSGDPMHWAYIAAGAEYNDTGADIIKTAPWADFADDEADKTVVHKAGYWYLNGLGDISNADIRLIYNDGRKLLQANIYARSKIRTNIYSESISAWWVSISKDLGGVFRSCDIEVVHTKNEKIGYPYSIKEIGYAFQSDYKFKGFTNVITVKEVRSFSNTFFKCGKLKFLPLRDISADIMLESSGLLTCKSILYMINNEAATNAITITLHTDAYARAMANADIVAALEAHPNVSLASA